MLTPLARGAHTFGTRLLSTASSALTNEDPNKIMAATSVTQQQTSTNLANTKRDAQCG